ncbi:MAG: ABC transporter substrate-binding protein [Thermoleophilia bacterium]|jgi:iron complex transport system substrate-binding protein
MRSRWFSVMIAVVLVAVLLVCMTGCGSEDTTSGNGAESTVSTAAGGSVDAASGTESTSGDTAGATSEMRTITNLDGSTIKVPVEARKVACLFGPSYEKVVLLGCEDKIIANGDFHIDGWPWSNVIYKRLNEVPGVPNAHADLNLEELVKMGPDLVFYFNRPEMVAQMEKLGLAVVPAVPSRPSESSLMVEDTKKMLMVYAEALGDERALKRAADYAQYFDEKLAMVTAITKGIPESERPSVYFANQDLLNASAKGSGMPEVVGLAGGAAVTKDLDAAYTTEITMEQLLQWDPQYIFIDHAGSSGNATAEEVIGSLSTDARFKDVTAVKNNQVKISPTGVFFWDAGVQKILQIMWMAQILHPDKFQDLDMKAELKDFYQRFFDYQLTDEQAEKILLHENP